MDLKRPNNLRLSGRSEAEKTAETGAGSGLNAPFPVNEVAELVADLLEATGLIAGDKLAGIRGRVKQGGSFAQALLEEGAASQEGIARTLASRFHLPFLDLPLTGVSEDAAKELPIHVMERVIAVPYALEGDVLRVAVADPGNVHAIDELRLATRFQLGLAVASREDIENEIRRLLRASEAFGARAAVEEDDGFLAEPEEETDDLEVDDGISDVPLVRLVNSIIFQAAEDGASDIHFEPQEDVLAVRLRIDGVLHEVQRIPRRMMPGVTTRLKVLAKLDIAERRKPQDGRISLNAAAAGRMMDVRVATLPTVEGEAVVMRLLDKSKKAPTLTELGLADDMRAKMEALIRRPTGAILVTGPTGSGKSTTLYAALTEINNPAINIITVEDPVEFRLAGVNQVQINTRAGLTFAAALRSILRSDPDVVMVGEIRDGETAKISIEAALTGHLVLSTLHTLNATETINRIISLFPLHQEDQIRAQLSAVIQGVVSQRLVVRADGKGRVPAVEVMMMTGLIRDSIREKLKTAQIPTVIAAGQAQYGMQTFDQSLWDLFQAGLINYETALENASNADDFKLRMQGISSTSDISRNAMQTAGFGGR